MLSKNPAESRQEKRASEGAGLSRQYGSIGISAVAAALRYQGDSKNTAYAPATAMDDHERFEVAA